MAVLGISVGSRSSGIAIIVGSELAEYGTLNASQPNSQAKSVMHYVRQFGVVTVVVKMPPATHITKTLSVVLAHLKDALRYQGCMVEYKDMEHIKRHIPSVTNKTELMAFLTERFPELCDEHRKELAGKKGYYVKLFEAVAVAYIHSQK